jgi:hypothetical protein
MPSWLPASVILAIAADLGLLYAWIVSSVEENCGDRGDGSSCSKLVRDLAPTALVVMVLVTLALLAFGVYASGRSRRGSKPGFFECKACGARSQSEEEAIDHRRADTPPHDLSGDESQLDEPLAPRVSAFASEGGYFW